MRYTVTNTSKNHRAVFTKNKPAGVHVPMGGSVEIEMTEDEAANAIAPDVSVVPVESDASESGTEGESKVAVKKVGSKFAVFLNGEQQGEPTTKAKADEAAKALKAELDKSTA